MEEASSLEEVSRKKKGVMPSFQSFMRLFQLTISPAARNHNPAVAQCHFPFFSETFASGTFFSFFGPLRLHEGAEPACDRKGAGKRIQLA